MLRKLGIEIRKIGDQKNFYKDVDQVLSSSSIPSQGVNGDIQVMAIKHSLHKMFNGRYFDVCTVDSCSGMAGIIICKERKEIYRSVHCMHYDEMLPEFRQQLLAMVMDDFRSIFLESTNEEVVETEIISYAESIAN